MANQKVDQKEQVRIHSRNWQNLISSPLEEDCIPQFLEQFNLYIEASLFPAPKHIQVLLYLSLLSIDLPPTIPTPLSLLEKLSSLHLASTFASSLPRPPANLAEKENPRWLAWEGTGKTERDAWRRMARCNREGIWALLWENNNDVQVTSSSKRRRLIQSRPRERVEEDEEDEEVEKADKRVSEKGWGLLKWLIGLWKKDIDHRGYSSLFLQQIPRPFSMAPNMQLDDASSPLAIIKTLLLQHETEPPAGKSRDRSIEMGEHPSFDLLRMLIKSSLGPTAPFHPASLQLSLLSLFRSLPYTSLRIIFSALRISSTTPRFSNSRSHESDNSKIYTGSVPAEIQPSSSPSSDSSLSIPPHVVQHLYMTTLEDLQGIRQRKNDERRKSQQSKTPNPELRNDDSYGFWKPPTREYIQNHLLILDFPRESDIRQVLKIVYVKIELVLCLLEPQSGMGMGNGKGGKSKIEMEEWGERAKKSVFWKDKSGTMDRNEERKDLQSLQDQFEIWVEEVIHSSSMEANGEK